jgi:hypothetical protein
MYPTRGSGIPPVIAAEDRCVARGPEELLRRRGPPGRTRYSVSSNEWTPPLPM